METLQNDCPKFSFEEQEEKDAEKKEGCNGDINKKWETAFPGSPSLVLIHNRKQTTCKGPYAPNRVATVLHPN